MESLRASEPSGTPSPDRRRALQVAAMMTQISWRDTDLAIPEEVDKQNKTLIESVRRDLLDHTEL